ncbi:hypothetical protein SeMB42_g03043 [Synchytrium endobioticum]|uniref:AN1-type domain-containing protein n=1 Tax=Synchytrium endobioticum TaxID=286115 RepID=A0A507DBW5_9FUNG|nr:hypothetical protein SeMB42_g03043 [Synchytrium endobioticum]
MGALLTILRGAHEDDVIDIPVDFSGATPCAAEASVYALLDGIMQPCEAHIASLKTYTGCGDAIRKAISTPSKESEDAAWAAVAPAVSRLSTYYELSQLIEEAYPTLLAFFCHGDLFRQLENCPATAKRLADLLWFCSLFDELKMANPSIQNDLSYYRRTLSRIRNQGQPQHGAVGDDLANRMSLFYAHANPMTKTVTDTTTAAIAASKGAIAEQVEELLALIAAICYNYVAKERTGSIDMASYCLRVMVTCIVVYDHVSPTGVFAKGSKINIKASVKVIREAAWLLPGLDLCDEDLDMERGLPLLRARVVSIHKGNMTDASGLMEIGVQCSKPSCQQLDFLPFGCSACGLIYCLDHRFHEAHNCSKWSANVDKVQVVCSGCGKMLADESNSLSDDELRKKHSDSACRDYVSRLKTRKTACGYRGCTSMQESVFAVACPKCRDMFCLKHRHPSTHDCRGIVAEQQAKEAKSKTAREFVESKIPSQASSRVATNTKKPAKYNLTVELMKMRMNSQGDSSIPITLRVYLRVFFPLESSMKASNYFFDKTWTVGRLVDKLADIAKLENVNNTHDSSRHLFIFQAETGSKTDGTTPLSVLTNGSRIILERGVHAVEPDYSGNNIVRYIGDCRLVWTGPVLIGTRVVGPLQSEPAPGTPHWTLRRH